MGANRLASSLIGLLLIAGAPSAQACIWDSDTLLQERITNPKMATAVLGTPRKPDVGRLQARIQALRAAPRVTDPSWWNDLAGAHIRLGEPQTAVALLEPMVRQFPNDYGVHANLGTAYHLLKRYPEAEREIARDLELNPNAHFGLERYHLALLQYLIRDPAYQARHVYVDEWTVPFLGTIVPMMRGPMPLLPPSARTGYVPDPTYDGSRPLTLAQELARARKELDSSRSKETSRQRSDEIEVKQLEAMGDRPPGYRHRWDLARDPKFAEGVIYMASLNREEPACWVMLGIASMHNSDLNLGAAAFQRAIDLGSPQAPVLKEHIQAIRRHQRQAAPHGLFTVGTLLVLATLVLFLLYRVFRRIRHKFLPRDGKRGSLIPPSTSEPIS